MPMGAYVVWAEFELVDGGSLFTPIDNIARIECVPDNDFDCADGCDDYGACDIDQQNCDKFIKATDQNKYETKLFLKDNGDDEDDAEIEIVGDPQTFRKFLERVRILQLGIK